MTKGMSTVIVRYLLGFAFLLFGFDGFLHYIPIPQARLPAERFIQAMIETGYFFQMVKSIEIFCGILLVGNLLVPIALILLAPLLVGISSIHLFLNPEGVPLIAVLVLLHAYMVRSYWPYFRAFFTYP